jgi:hypothetical protein
VEETTLEHEYVNLLLQDLLNGGQFPPHDAFWASRNLPRWCRRLALEPHRVREAEYRFVVDLDAEAGLTRLSLETTGTCLQLDTTPLLEAIRDDIAALRDETEAPGDGSPLGRDRRVRLLRKLGNLYAPKPPLIARRGERKPVALTVEVVAGMSEILRALREKSQASVTAAAPAVPEIEEITITAFGASNETPTLGGPSTVAGRSTGQYVATYPVMKLVDRSASGCRLDGQMFAAIRVTPGALIAFREHAALPWALAVVRRVERLAGKAVAEDGTDRGQSPEGASRRFPAIYLPESAKYPVLPIRTLLLPARIFVPGEQLALQAADAVYTIQLKEALEEQGDFIWSPFETLGRKPAQGSPRADPSSRPN